MQKQAVLLGGFMKGKTMTDREKLIELFVESAAMDYKDSAAYFLDNGVTIQNWIPVSERLPDENQVVLCMRRNGSYWVAQWTYIDWMWYDENEWRTEKEVTHWMPLPEPPKEDV
jgi:hypothetical protein